MFLRTCVWAVMAGVLVGCSDVAEVTGGIADRLSRVGAPPDATSDGIRTLSMLRGDVSVRGPEGYCIDQGASNARRGFAVMAGCALLTEDAPLMPVLDGLITVQFGAADTASVAGNEDVFAAFLESEAGRGLLAGDSDPLSVVQVSTVLDASGVMVRFEDLSGPSFAGTSGPQWRGFVDINGRLATISVLSFDRNTLSRNQSVRLMIVAMNELVEVNTVAAVAEAATQ